MKIKSAQSHPLHKEKRKTLYSCIHKIPQKLEDRWELNISIFIFKCFIWCLICFLLSITLKDEKGKRSINITKCIDSRQLTMNLIWIAKPYECCFQQLLFLRVFLFRFLFLWMDNFVFEESTISTSCFLTACQVVIFESAH